MLLSHGWKATGLQARAQSLLPSPPGGGGGAHDKEVVLLMAALAAAWRSLYSSSDSCPHISPATSAGFNDPPTNSTSAAAAARGRLQAAAARLTGKA